MREIKFRAFSKNLKVPGSNEFMEYSDKIALAKFFEIYPKQGTVLNGASERFIMQFTGLKDKQGTPIYEGDIFQVANNKIYTVKFCEGAESGNDWYGGCFVLYDSEELFFPFDEYAIRTGKVIGNVHQNPDLLK